VSMQTMASSDNMLQLLRIFTKVRCFHVCLIRRMSMTFSEQTLRIQVSISAGFSGFECLIYEKGTRNHPRSD
jgi:hypothetical protein